MGFSVVFALVKGFEVLDKLCGLRKIMFSVKEEKVLLSKAVDTRGLCYGALSLELSSLVRYVCYWVLGAPATVLPARACWVRASDAPSRLCHQDSV